MFRYAGTALRRLKIISTIKHELDLPGVAEAGLVNLTHLVLCNVTLGSQLTKLIMLKSGLKITQLTAEL